jgi:hypothetical protein
MHTRLLAAAAALVAFGCTRNLDLPTTHPVALAPATSSAAPREVVQLTASGGAGGYRYAFAPGSPLSGSEASVDPATGLYRAGSIGPAQDVVQVTDAAGRSAEARVTVGTPLSSSPLVVVLSPGGDAVIAGVGGKPPYAFALVDAQPLSTIVVAPDGLSATYRAGPLGDRIETIELRDETYDPADPDHAVATAAVRIGPAVQIYANTSGSVAPFEGVDFLAVGGQPPYTFFFANAAGLGPPSGGTIGATGHYEAGPVGAGDGSVFDDVTVHDVLGQIAAPLRMTVGAPLALSLPVVRLSPGVAVGLVATGGKPPYQFGFDVRGNRTAGTVDGVTGTYVPGDAQGASDKFAVTDATHKARATVAGPPIGYRSFFVGGTQRRSLEARLRGEFQGTRPIQDVLVFRYAFASLVGVTTLLFPRGMDPQVETGFTPKAEGEPFAVDLDDDQQDEIVVFRPGGIDVFDPDLGGGLAFRNEIGSVSASSFAVARSTVDKARFFTTVSCAGALGPGLVDVDFTRASGSEAGCVPGPTPSLGSLVLGDFDGDGLQDLANVSYSGVSVAYGNGSGFNPFVAVPFPSGCSPNIQTMPLWASGLAAAGTSDPADATPRILVPLSCSSGLSSVAMLARLDARSPGSPAWSPAAPVDLGRTTTGTRIAAYSPGPGAAPLVAAWDMYSNEITAVSIDPSGNASVFDPLPGPLAEGLQHVSFPDVNGDGVPDLFAAGITDTSYLLLGDGDGRFGRRARVPGLGSGAVLDVDGDGLDDLVAGANGDGNALVVLFGGEHQLARGPVTPTVESVGQLTVGDLGAGYPEVVYQGRTGTFYRARIFPDGTFGTQQAIAITNAPFVPFLNGLKITQLGGTADRDLWASYATAPNPSAAVVFFDTPTSARLFITGLSAPGCKFAPVGSGDATSPADLVSLCTSGNDLVLRRTTFTGSGYGTWSTINTWTGAAGSAAFVTYGGRDRYGNAYLVGAPGGVPSRNVLVVTVAPPGSRGGTLTWSQATLGQASALPGGAGMLIDVTGDGAADLVLTGAGRGQVFPGTDLGGVLSFAPGATFTAPASGNMQSAARLAPGVGRDLLVKLGDYYLVVRSSGPGTFE